MAKQSPLQIVKEKFGSKEKLVEALVNTLEKNDGESAEDFQARLLSVSNKKLLRLHATQERVSSEFGNKETLVDKIVALKFDKPNADYKAKLMKYRVTRLLDLHTSFARKKA